MKQQDIFTDLPRGEQLNLLRKLKLPAHVHKSGKVSGAVQKAVLRAIDDHEGRHACYASQATLADEIGRGVRTVARAIAGLIALDLITVERPHRMAPNHHRIAWNSVKQLVAQRSATNVRSSAVSRLRSSTVSSSLSNRHGVRQTVKLNENTTDQPTEAEVVAVTNELYEWGLKTARDSVAAARQRGWSIEYIRQLHKESGGDNSEPEPWQPGQLANWLTGKTFPPFDEAESERRAAKREAVDEAKADEIRESINSQAERENRPDWIAAGIVARKLKESGLDRFTTTSERDGQAKLNAADRSVDRTREVSPQRDSRDELTAFASPPR